MGLIGLGHQDGDPGFEFWRLNGDGQPPGESRFQSFIDAVDVFRVAIAGQNDLLAPIDQRVEGVEKFLLRPFLVREEMNVVNQQRVDRAVVVLEAFLSTVADRRDHVVQPLFGAQVSDVGVRVVLLNAIAHGMHQMRLAQARLPVDEQRVVGHARGFDDVL